MYWWLFLLCPIAYLIGSLNISRFITRLRHVDLTHVGSGNVGATNVWRAMGFKWFLLVLFLEIFKCAAVALTGYLFVSLRTQIYYYTEMHYIVLLSMGLAAVLGSIFPVWHGFKGGKGVANWIGFGFVINPLVMLAAALIFTPLLAITRIMSISTLLGLIFWAVMSIWLEVPQTAPVIALYCCFVVVILFAHRKNIIRIFTGKEKRLSFGKNKK